jgi:hypothetical protein
LEAVAVVEVAQESKGYGEDEKDKGGYSDRSKEAP